MLTIYVSKFETIESVKIKIQEKDGIPFESQLLIFNGRSLENQNTILNYDIIKESTLHLVLRVRGGMMHKSSGRRDFEYL